MMNSHPQMITQPRYIRSIATYFSLFLKEIGKTSLAQTSFCSVNSSVFRPLLALSWASGSGQTVNFERVNELLVIRKKPVNQKEENEEVDLAINTAVPNVPTIPPPTIQGVLSLKTEIYPYAS